MFDKFGNLVSRFWPIWLFGWIFMGAASRQIAPHVREVSRDGDFRYLPDSYPSRRAENLFRQAFSRDPLGSTVVIVVRRESRAEGLIDTKLEGGKLNDFEFIDQVLRPRIEAIAEEDGGLAVGSDDNGDSTSSGPSITGERSVIARVRMFNDPGLGDLLVSEDRKATLVMVELTTEFQEKRNRQVIEKIEKLIARDGDLQLNRQIPPGLDLELSGSATVGRDMRLAAEQSANAADLATILLVLGLLFLIYRAPFLIMIPLTTVYISVQVALRILAMMADAGWITLFTGIDTYVKVVLYGAGVDFCVFLMARYKEELDGGASVDEAIASAVGKVGVAITASAATTMAGIGMMMFAEFGKFRQAGFAMSFSLVFVLVASLTFAPALLRLAGRWAFWPQVRSERVAQAAGWISPTSLLSRVLSENWVRALWDRIAAILLRRPGQVLALSLLLMLPFALIAVFSFDKLSYGLLSELPDTAPSVSGTAAVQKHFPAGATGPVSVLIKNPNVDFSRQEMVDQMAQLSRSLEKIQDELGIVDIRTIANPLGLTSAAERAAAEEEKMLEGRSAPQRIAYLGGKRKRVQQYYVSDKIELKGQVTRMDIIFRDDPFTRGTIRQFEVFEKRVAEILPPQLAQGTEMYFLGATPNMRDLKTITERDQVRIDLLCVIAVFLILVILMRIPAVSVYLVLSVLASYLVTLGVTFVVFWALDPTDFSGIDWKVPMFLFTILIAVGEDYNIYLIARIQEEQKKYGPVLGITVALARTGSIISSCGIIMAGTFAALMFGSLVGMQQLGFALAFGVLLDTFVVRPILVPAYMILLNSGRMGSAGRWLGAVTEQDMPTPSQDAPHESVPVKATQS